SEKLVSCLEGACGWTTRRNPQPSLLVAVRTPKMEAYMKTFASILALSACLAAFPAVADTFSTNDPAVVLTCGQLCVGPACVGRDRYRDREYRHGRGYG